MFGHQRFGSAFVSVLLAVAPLVASAAPAGAAAPPSVAAADDTCDPIVSFQASDFSNPTRIDNQWEPLVPGTQLTWEGRSYSGGEFRPHSIVATVTDLTKVINGVRTVVLWERDFQDGVLTEGELAFRAQDDRGNGWNLGQYPEEYRNGRFIGARRTWIAGQVDAEGGLATLGEPSLGTPPYLQGRILSIGWLDCAQVVAMDQTVCVPVQCFDHVLVTDETSPLVSETAHQRKFYAPKVGNIQVTALDDPDAETLVLVKIENLGPDGLAQARADALKVEAHAYQISEVYRSTPPAVSCAMQADDAADPACAPGGPIAEQPNSTTGDQGQAPGVVGNPPAEAADADAPPTPTPVPPTPMPAPPA